MKFSLASFVTLALASLSLAVPTEVQEVQKRHGPGKRGLVWTWYNGGLDPGRLNDGQGTVNLIYDYETAAPLSTNGNGGLAFIGMQRCLDCDSSPISQLAARQRQIGFVTIFTLNEPDQNGISPSQAASWYKTNINPLAIKKALPAVSSSTNSGQGLDWVAQMISACGGGCFYDYINLVSPRHDPALKDPPWEFAHPFMIYSFSSSSTGAYGQNFAQFQAHVNNAHSRFPNNKIVVTEFALQNPPGGQADQLNFFKQAFAFLDSASFVEMYFPFAATTPNLFNSHDANPGFLGTSSMLYNNDGTISEVGKLLLSA
ncbi:Glyco-hydro-cc domain-containing protein [Favolaschia claudopus]|uniref:Glyco-hydro-cc domain-containing protein n=1 Tax=Favolaschia claudopus TaxID=2862362 RepID=A0AAW0CH67_9AGAR